LRSDGGQEFLGGVIVGVTRLMGVTKHVVVPYTPTANGIVERANRAVLERLREIIFSKRLVRHTQHQWSDLLPLVQRAINASDHSAIGTTPARILFGDSLDLDRCLLSDMPEGRTLDVLDYVDALAFNRVLFWKKPIDIKLKFANAMLTRLSAISVSNATASSSILKLKLLLWMIGCS
jgi:hypothetical protein